ncbi:MAG: ATP-binding protein [Caldicoprobacterales bacterium]|jgi:DNA replication protein DnaC|nr:ATP-binding protein [Clostridiales bacterium]
MSKFILRDILQEYDEIRREAAQALDLRRQEIAEKVPEVVKIHQDMIDLMAQRSREIILNPNTSSDAIDQLQEQITRLKARQLQLLEKKGYPRDYLEIKYRCSHCQDTGYVGYPVREKCRCLIQRLLEKTYQMSNIQELDRENFSTFDPMVFPEEPLENSKLNQRQYMVQLRDRLIDYVSEFPDNDKRTILFTGKTGLGKTFLLNCMAKAIMDKGYTVIRISAYKLFDQLFYSAISDKSDYESLQSQLFEVDALIIDDLGTETRRNNYTTEDLFNIINERTMLRSHTFLSTNLGLSELKQRYSDRITSRLFDTSNTMLIRFQGNDIRLRQTAK